MATIEEQKFEKEYDISGVTFEERITFNFVDFSQGIKAVGTIFKEGVVFNNCKIRSINFCKAVIKGAFKLYSDEIVDIQWGMFTGAIFEDGLSIDNCSFISMVSFDQTTINDNIYHYDYNSFITNTKFNELVDFSNSTINSRLKFENVIFVEDLDFVNVTTLIESYNYSNFSLSFQNITVLKKAKLRFIGNETNRMFKSDVGFSVHEIEGVIIFEYANVFNIDTIGKAQLDQLVNENKVVFGKGCSEFRHKTDVYSARFTGSLVSKLVEEIAIVFTNFFTIHNKKNLGVKVFERNPTSISYYYYSDDDFTVEEFENALSDAEQGMKSIFRNESPQHSSGNNLSVITKPNEQDFIKTDFIKIDLASILFKISSGLERGQIEVSELHTIFNAIPNSEELGIYQDAQQVISNFSPDSLNIFFQPNIKMSKYIFEGPVTGAIGDGATVTNLVVQQNSQTLTDGLDFEKLSNELAMLRVNLASKAKGAEEYSAIVEVASAEEASNQKDGKKMLEHLKNASVWVLETAKEIGVDIVSELIKKQMTL
jgi:hypothetical protein